MARRPAPPPATPSAAPSGFRSGAVARLAGMPVATLRVWEQRYQAVSPATAASGHRLYSPADVQRVLLLRQLTEQGHAIGSIAGLDAVRLQQVARAGGRADTARLAARPPAPLRLVVVGRALAERLTRPAVIRSLALPARLLAVCDSLADAAQGVPAEQADLLVWQCPGLDGAVPDDLGAAQAAWQARQVAVVYRYAGAAAVELLTTRGVQVWRESPDDTALGAWLASLEAAGAAQAVDTAPARATRPRPEPPSGDPPPRRYDDAALSAIAGLPQRLACECPRHVAELLMQLASFEAYSAACTRRSAADADLHAYLAQVAGASRALFESALDRVARHEGLALP